MSDNPGREQIINHHVVNVMTLSEDLRTSIATVAGIIAAEDTMTVIHTSEDTGNDGLAADLVAGHNALAVSTDKSFFIADDVEVVTITCSDAAISGDTTLNYEVWLVLGEGRVLDEAGTVAVVGGVATLTYSTPLAGVYQFRLARQNDVEDGFAESEAV